MWLNRDVDGTDGPRAVQLTRDCIIHAIELSFPETERSLKGLGADAVLTSDGVLGDDRVRELMDYKVCESRFKVADKAAGTLP